MFKNVGGEDEELRYELFDELLVTGRQLIIVFEFREVLFEEG